MIISIREIEKYEPIFDIRETAQRLAFITNVKWKGNI